MKRSTLLSTGTPLLVAAAAVFALGDLNPPAGSVTASGKRLTEIEPRIAINATNTPGDADSIFKITQPGSYYLTGNVTGAPGKHGIEIATYDVTLDLNGFELIGSGATSLDGISTTSSSFNITVRNGTIRSWGDDGLDLNTQTSVNSVVENILANGNLDVGIAVGLGSVVSGCVARNNATGILTFISCTVRDCTATLNGVNGFQLFGDCQIFGCTAPYNGTNGIDAGNACSVMQCVVTTNGSNGIAVLGDCRVVGNTCDQNGFGAGVVDGAGILATSSDNRIEANNCTDNLRGLDVNASGNIILRNTCSGNTTDWDIVAQNVFGPIIDRRTPASAAVVGFSAASSLGTTDANANFSY